MQGKDSATTAQKKYVIEAGNFIIISSGTYYQFASDDATSCTIFWVHFKDDTALSVIEFVHKQSAGYKGFIKYNENCFALFNKIYGQLERGFRQANLLYANMCCWYFLSSFIFNEKFKPAGAIRQKGPVDGAMTY